MSQPKESQIPHFQEILGHVAQILGLSAKLVSKLAALGYNPQIVGLAHLDGGLRSGLQTNLVIHNTLG